MVYWAILFYQDYRSHAKKATDLPLLFLQAKGFLSQTLSFFDVQSDKNAFFEVFKVSKTKGIALDEFDEIISGFQFGVGIG